MSTWIRANKALVITLTAVLVATILYWPTLGLPVLYDDLNHIRIAQTLNFKTVWLPTDAFSFYRPFMYMPFLIMERLLGRYPAWLLHGLNIAQHAFNTGLLVALSWRLWSHWPRALAAGLLFALFPFSYQAVAVYGHNIHPTIMGLLLLALHTYLSGIRQQRRIWWVLTTFLFGISLFTHEAIALFGPLAALVHWQDEPPRSWRQWLSPRRSPWLIYTILSVLYLVVYQFLPITRATYIGDSSSGLWQRLLYIGQAAAYPVTWLAHKLPQLSAHTIVISGVALTLALTAWAARERSNRLPLLLSWGWWGLAALLVAVPLPTSYLLHGPRLLYVSSVGLALLWPILLHVGTTKHRGTTLLSVALLAFILVTNWQFVNGRLAAYTRLTNPIHTITDTMTTQEPTQGIVLVNLPQWTAPQRNTYPIGSELVAMLGNYLFAHEIMAANLPHHPATYPIVVSELLAETPYAYGVHNEANFRKDDIGTLPLPVQWAAQGSQVFVIHYAVSGPTATHVGGFTNTPAPAAPLAHFTYYDLLSATATLCEGTVQTTFTWQPQVEIPGSTSIFVQLLAADGQLITQADGPPLEIRPDLLQMAPNWAVTDQRTLHPPAETTPTHLLIGTYDFVTGTRLPATDAAQAPLADNALRLPIHSCASP